MAISIRSVRSGKPLGGRTEFIVCWNRARSFRRPICWRFRWICHRHYDRMCADKFVYALDHAPKLPKRAKRAADILRDWDGRMSADSPAPTIETKARAELVRMLLEPKLGTAAMVPQRRRHECQASAPNATTAKETGALTWKSYRWGMSTVWLENSSTNSHRAGCHQGYSDYGSAADGRDGERAETDRALLADLDEMEVGRKLSGGDRSHLVLSQLPLPGADRARATSLERGQLTVKAVGRGTLAHPNGDLEFCEFRREHFESCYAERAEFFPARIIWISGRRGMGVRRFAFPFSRRREKNRAHEMTLEPR